jgi:hypothetical protein
MDPPLAMVDGMPRHNQDGRCGPVRGGSRYNLLGTWDFDKQP